MNLGGRSKAAVVVVVLLAAACGGDDAGGTADIIVSPTATMPRTEDASLSDPPAGVLDREWNAVVIFQGDEDIPPPAGAVPTVVFGESTVAGTAGCNTYSGDAAFAATLVEVFPLAITEMACTDSQDWFAMLDVLEAAIRVELAGDNLLVWAEDGRVLLLE